MTFGGGCVLIFDNNNKKTVSVWILYLIVILHSKFKTVIDDKFCGEFDCIIFVWWVNDTDLWFCGAANGKYGKFDWNHKRPNKKLLQFLLSCFTKLVLLIWMNEEWISESSGWL